MQPANGIEAYPGGNQNQFIADFVNLEPGFAEKHSFLVFYYHNGRNDLCVFDIECLEDGDSAILR